MPNNSTFPTTGFVRLLCECPNQYRSAVKGGENRGTASEVDAPAVFLPHYT